MKHIIPVLLAVVLTACGIPNDETLIRQLCAEMTARYPAATLQDVYKTCYQDYFGAEHLMRDTVAARHYLHAELEQCAGTDMTAMPLREPTGFRHQYVRVNLMNITEGYMTEEELLRLFIEAAGSERAKGDADMNEWADEWRRIERIATEVHPAWRDEALQQALQQAAETNAAVRHSEPFRNTYNPHYRIIRL